MQHRRANLVGGRKVPGKYTRAVIKRSAFIIPSQPVSRKESPSGPQWIHEAKFDGWRAQLHKAGDDVAIFTRKGNDCTSRFPSIRDTLLMLPLNSAIIDAEAVACGEDGKPDIRLMTQHPTGALCAWCFDLLELNGRDLRPLALMERRIRLRHLLAKADEHAVRYSDEFHDPVKLLAAVEQQGLEGIVSKLTYQPYRSGKNPGWIKVKTATWREASRDRWELFQRER
jgi:bifunctional non-homologous end joining protein LigD